MPKLLNQALYDATFQAAKSIISSTSATFNSYLTALPANTALYRYSSQQYSDGSETGARKNWTTIDRDTGNRWTGISGTGSGASGGLYMSLEAEGYKDTEFSELYHYQDQDSHRGMTGIEFYEYNVKKRPDSAFVQARTLYYMFMFFLQRPLKGIDLTKGAAAITDTYASAKASSGSQFQQSADELYMESDDASFCRAIGNACFQESCVDFILVTSTRNTTNKNVILKCDGGVDSAPLDFLKPAGRSSFFLHGDGSRQAEVTVDDMKYNAQFGT